MALRGVRGAIDVSADEPEAILSATRALLRAIRESNPEMLLEDLASALFSTTADLNSVPPAQAARELGWTQVPLLCLQEMRVAEGLPRLIRVLVHWNTPLPQRAIRHVYLGRAVSLRPDLEPHFVDGGPVRQGPGWAARLRSFLHLRFLRTTLTDRSGESHDGHHESGRRLDPGR